MNVMDLLFYLNTEYKNEVIKLPKGLNKSQKEKKDFKISSYAITALKELENYISSYVEKYLFSEIQLTISEWLEIIVKFIKTMKTYKETNTNNLYFEVAEYVGKNVYDFLELSISQ